MLDGAPLFQLLYVSQLAADCDFGVVKDVVDVSRRRNPALGLTGALLFDGGHFCQLIEGAEGDALELMSRIQRDPRHTDLQLLHAGSAAGARLLNRWASGYCDSHELEPFLGSEGLRGQLARDAFLSVLKGADME